MKTCGGKTRAGGACAKPRGWGTDHPGSGRCKFHGGSSRNGRKAANRERALEFARGALGAEVAASPVDAMEEAVRLSVGLIAYYRHELADAAALLGRDEAAARAKIAELAGPYTEALRLERDVAKAALDAKVAERRQALAERDAARLVDAIASGLNEAFGDLATPERRALFAEVVFGRLQVLEVEDAGPLALASGG